MSTQTSTQIAREAPFMEDYRRRLLDGVYGGTEVYKQGDTLPPGAKIGDKKDPGILDTPAKQFNRGIASFAPTESAAFSQAATQMGIDPTTGQQTGVASFQPFIQKAGAGLDQAITGLGMGQATMGGTFGGSRYGVQQAELAKNLQDIKSKRIFEDLSRNFMQAQQADIATSEAARTR